jgi:hypothetical protein
VAHLFELGCWARGGRVLTAAALQQLAFDHRREIAAATDTASSLMASSYARGVESMHRALGRALPDVPVQLLARAMGDAVHELPAVEVERAPVDVPDALAEVAERLA